MPCCSKSLTWEENEATWNLDPWRVIEMWNSQRSGFTLLIPPVSSRKKIPVDPVLVDWYWRYCPRHVRMITLKKRDLLQIDYCFADWPLGLMVDGKSLHLYVVAKKKPWDISYFARMPGYITCPTKDTRFKSLESAWELLGTYLAWISPDCWNVYGDDSKVRMIHDQKGSL